MGLVRTAGGDDHARGPPAHGAAARAGRPRGRRARTRGPPHLRRPDRGREPAPRPRRAPRARGARRGPRCASSSCSRSCASSGERQAGALSGGQQQQLAIARAMVARPDVLLLDEPSLGLSPTMVDVVFGALEAIRERGLAVLLVEQRAQRTVALADRTHVLANGELRADPDPGRRRRHRAHDRGVPGMNAAFAILGLGEITGQVLTDAIALGATYALMAVGIGLVFGVLRLVNFAYGQLIMAGAYTLALTSDWRLAFSIVACFAVVIGLSIAWSGSCSGRCARPRRRSCSSTTFAVALPAAEHRAAQVRRARRAGFGARRRSPSRSRSHGIDVRKVTIVAVASAAVALLAARAAPGPAPASACTCARPRPTSRPPACSACARTRVILFAVVLSGALAATVAIILTVTNPLVTPDFALRETIVVLVGVVVGGINRLLSATLGGFAIGFATGLLGGDPADRQERLPAELRVRARDPRAAAAPGRPVRAARRRRRGARMRRAARRRADAGRAVRARPGGRARRRTTLVARERDPRAERDRGRGDRRRALRLRRQLGRPLVRARLVRGRRRVLGRPHEHPARVEERRAPRHLSVPARHTYSNTVSLAARRARPAASSRSSSASR